MSAKEKARKTIDAAEVAAGEGTREEWAEHLAVRAIAESNLAVVEALEELLAQLAAGIAALHEGRGYAS